MNDNCLRELHLLANTLCNDDILYIIWSNIENLQLTIVDNQYTSKKNKQLKVMVICTY